MEEQQAAKRRKRRRLCLPASRGPEEVEGQQGARQQECPGRPAAEKARTRPSHYVRHKMLLGTLVRLVLVAQDKVAWDKE